MFKNPASIYLLQVNNGNTRTRGEICSYVNKGAKRDTWNNAWLEVRLSVLISRVGRITKRETFYN